MLLTLGLGRSLRVVRAITLIGNVPHRLYAERPAETSRERTAGADSDPTPPPPSRTASFQHELSKIIQNNLPLTTSASLQSTLRLSKNQIDKLPSHVAAVKGLFSQWLLTYLDSVQDTVMVASKTLNDVTGYSGIAALKRSIEELEADLALARVQVKRAKEAYTAAIAERSTSQKEVNELLQRKHLWTSADLGRFTQLFHSDHQNEKTEAESAKKLAECEQTAEEVQLKLTQAILTRYHEEQIWSDKIRRTSTWGTVVIMAVNLVLFLVVQLLLEPWKRKRLVGSFEEKVKNVLEASARELEARQAERARTEPVAVELEEGAGGAPTEVGADAVPLVSPAYHTLRVSLPHPTWSAFKAMVVENYTGLETQERVMINRTDLGWLGLTAASVGCLVGVLITSWR